jgi:hypothetical protein
MVRGEVDQKEGPEEWEPGQAFIPLRLLREDL